MDIFPTFFQGFSVREIVVKVLLLEGIQSFWTLYVFSFTFLLPDIVFLRNPIPHLFSVNFKLDGYLQSVVVVIPFYYTSLNSRANKHRVCFYASTMTMSAIANSNQNRNVSVYVSCSNKMKSKQKGIGMYTKTCKICNWHLLPSFHYFATSNAGYTKGQQ